MTIFQRMVGICIFRNKRAAVFTAALFLIYTVKMIMKIKVFPGAGKDEIVKKENSLEVWTKAKPIQGQANRAVVKALEKYFSKQVRIVKGFRERNKIIEIDN